MNQTDVIQTALSFENSILVIHRTQKYLPCSQIFPRNKCHCSSVQCISLSRISAAGREKEYTRRDYDTLTLIAG